MSPDLAVSAGMGVVAAVAVIVVFAVASGFTVGHKPQEPLPPLQPEPSAACAQHDWGIAAREERAGVPRLIYRCRDCGLIETRDVP